MSTNFTFILIFNANSNLVKDDSVLTTERNLLFEVVNLEEERDDLVRVLLDSGADTDSPNQHGLMPLHSAAGKGYTNIVRLLLKRGADIDPTFGIIKTTPLRLATVEDHTEAAKVLLRAGANPYFQDDFEYNALMASASNGNEELTRLLIDVYDVEINVATSLVGGLRTPLHFAAHEGHPKVAKLLIKNGAKLDAQDSDLRTPFHRIVFHQVYSKGREATLEVLIKAVVDAERAEILEIQNNKNKTPLQTALDKAYPSRPFLAPFSYL